MSQRRTSGSPGTKTTSGVLSRSPDALPSPSYPNPKTKHAYFVFGRFQPFTIGHAKLLEVGKMLADSIDDPDNKADFFVFPSDSANDEKNPLKYEDKVKYMRIALPQYNIYNVLRIPKKIQKNAHSPVTVAEHLKQIGYTEATWVVGSDRDKPIPGLSTISHPSLKRDPNATGENNIAKISGTLVRKLAEDGNFAAFETKLGGVDDGHGNWKRRLFDKLRVAIQQATAEKAEKEVQKAEEKQAKKAAAAEKKAAKEAAAAEKKAASRKRPHEGKSQPRPTRSRATQPAAPMAARGGCGCKR